MKILRQCIPVVTDHFCEPVDFSVQGQIFFPHGVVGFIVFDGHAVCQLVVGKKLSVAVIDISAAAFQCPGLCRLYRIIVRVVSSFYDLQVEQTRHKSRRHAEGYQQKDQGASGKKLL